MSNAPLNSGVLLFLLLAGCGLSDNVNPRAFRLAEKACAPFGGLRELNYSDGFKDTVLAYCNDGKMVRDAR